MGSRARIIGILSAPTLLLGIAIKWLSGNFFYEIFWAALESHHIRQAVVIAYVSSHLMAFLLAAAIVVLVYAFGRFERPAPAQGIAPRQHETPARPSVKKNVQTSYGFLWIFLWAFALPAAIGYGIPTGIIAIMRVTSGDAVTVISDPPQSIRQNADGSERIFIQVSPDDINRNFEGRTTAQADALIEPYISKWIAFEGSVSDVYPTTASLKLIMVVFRPSNAVLLGKVTVNAFFDNGKWHDKISIMQSGNVIKAACRIEKISDYSFDLRDCELF